MADFDKRKQGVEPKEKLTNVQRLMDIINNRRDSGVRQPVGMPERQQDAAEWFIKLLEPRLKHEIDEQLTSNKGSNIGSKYWVMPYQERLADCLTIFYKMSHADQQQIIEWSKNKIMWRGDDMKFMRLREKVDMDKIDKTKLFTMMKTIIARG